uniref:Uncharacterized protein n=1 Tax=Craspedostauros australis TaxID=1486917 RepID=A0A7R9ZJA9_9STRA|mmetsp:Transcript_14705/g.40655  ORF Transcript_14705/g.40655 Transcript_14705/m.40655 type:complete len:133 (+) Transcript_14705:356-754(+)
MTMFLPSLLRSATSTSRSTIRSKLPQITPLRFQSTSQGSLVLRRLQDALEEYRSANYSRELPSRFKKDIVIAAQTFSAGTVASSVVVTHGLNQVLENINLQDKVSAQDVDVLFAELGEGTGAIPVDVMMEIL